MKTITISYTVLVQGHNEVETERRACIDVSLSNKNCAILLAVGTGRETAIYERVENLVRSAERLKDRQYVEGSIYRIALKS